MIKFLDERIPPVKYVLTQDNRLHLQPIPDIVSISVENSQSLTNELGRQLLKASSDGDIQDVEKLLNQGCPFTSDWLGTSPLHLAAQNNQVEICEMLMRGGISKDVRNKVDKTPLHLSAYEGHYQASELLIKHGSDVNACDMLNMTPLHWAVQNEHTSVVELLVRNGSLTNIRNKFDLTPQDIALQINKLEIVELLQAYEGDAQTEAQTLVMQLDDQMNEISESYEIMDSPDPIEPVIVVEDDFTSASLEKPVHNKNEPVIVNLCSDEVTDEYTTNTKSKDPVIINLASDMNEEMPLVGQKVNPLSSTPMSHFKVVDGVIQPSDEDTDNNFSAIQLLQEHGITMLPTDNDDSTILNAVMENGHSVVLTDVGKEVLNSLKQQEENQVPDKSKPKKIIRVMPEQFLTMTNSSLARDNILPGTLKVVPVKPNIKRVVMKKNRPTPFSNMIKIQTVKKPKTELEKVMDELAQAKRIIEEYKSKLKRKEIEVERYKIQLKLLMDSS